MRRGRGAECGGEGRWTECGGVGRVGVDRVRRGRGVVGSGPHPANFNVESRSTFAFAQATMAAPKPKPASLVKAASCGLRASCAGSRLARWPFVRATRHHRRQPKATENHDRARRHVVEGHW